MGWIDVDATWYEVDLGAGHIVLDRVPAIWERGTVAFPPLFGACLLWPRSPISATAELLFFRIYKWNFLREVRFWAAVCKRFALYYWTVVLFVCHVCDVGALWPNGWMDQDEAWHAGRPRPWPHCVRRGPSSPSHKGAKPPIFGPYLLRPNGWMDQMPLGMEVGLGPGDFVLDGDPADPP